MTTITLNSPKTLVTTPAQETTFTKVKLGQVSYDNDVKKAWIILYLGDNAAIKQLLWEGADFDAAGQFTDADVESKVRSILGI